MKKLSLRQKMQFTMGVLFASLALTAIGCTFRGWALFLFLPLGLALLVVGFALKLKWWNCPHCHAGLGYYRYYNFCAVCGEKIDYDAKEE